MELLLLDLVEVEHIMIVVYPNITQTCYIAANINFPICITMYAQALLKKESLLKFSNCSNLMNYLKLVSKFETSDANESQQYC